MARVTSFRIATTLQVRNKIYKFLFVLEYGDIKEAATIEMFFITIVMADDILGVAYIILDIERFHFS
jgi:hypothetical protein